ncbi:N,N-dimethylformamidase beta subunit family domain-containing protein [Calothrix sp. UHCC 0171]|uniref:N,N-dimethylformamidase beta subunit family domain-containing protein n=1 Tax=Calothrix sp. UHCC 0171 TaxID=3110245 RepID=UPI002B1FE977|nr:N,N-dimethylformamidase beta subunit family domain-containing protein [Calothrix sp. UHCC 0171]MEA5569665.1 N,N-dimethylformamidase beta subunit family domain-containing protein [Calothrix sp. UHCC 0171]
MLSGKQLNCYIRLLKVLLSGFLSTITVLLFLQIPVYGGDLSISKPENNPIIIENLKPGTKDWQLIHPARNREIEGYASLTSVNRGDKIKLFVNTKDPGYTIEIYRMGWYQGQGGRQITPAIFRESVKQPLPIVDQTTGLIECNWQDPYVLQIPSNYQDSSQWASGFYLAKLTASKSGKQSYIIFIVRDDSRPSDILLQSSVTTYQAYNNWGTMSLYRWNSQGKQASKVSFNRPYAMSPNRDAAYGVGAGEFLTNFQPKRRTSSAGWEYNMVRWLEKNGYDVTYSSNIDTHENHLDKISGKTILFLHKAFLSVGHDEYWSWQMRNNVEAARDAGVSLGFFSANTCYWQIRLEPSRITGDINRTIVSYKEAEALDPFARDRNLSNDYLITTLWRRKPVNRPEDALIGVMYDTFQVNADILIPNTAPEWLLADTQLSKNTAQTSKNLFGFGNPTTEMRLSGLLGYEVDKMFNSAPENTIRIAHSPYRHGGRTKYSDMTVYTANSGATVFATGTIQWSWGLDNFNAPQLRPTLLNQDAQIITRNVLAKMLKSGE